MQSWCRVNRCFQQTRSFAKVNLARPFIDKITIQVNGGKGGNGCLSFEVLSPSKKRPNGGNGGRGGSVYIIADRNMVDLRFETTNFNAGNGTHGSRANMTGRNGKDVYIRVPIGTLVSDVHQTEDTALQEVLWVDDDVDDSSDNESAYDDDGGEGQAEDRDNSRGVTAVQTFTQEEVDAAMEKHSLSMQRDVFDLSTDGLRLLAVEGGKAGIGNASTLGTGGNRKSVPKAKMPGQAGQRRTLLLELKTIADVGLVGFPNAGKSSLLTALSNATPKVASYAFTTLHPSVGIVEYSDTGRITVADIPGLIEGAHDNRGLGHDFLRHIERTKVLLYVLDGAGTEGRDPTSDMKALVNELELHDTNLALKPSLIFVNKVDLKIDEFYDAIRKLATRRKMDILFGSALTYTGMGALAKKLREMVEAERQRETDRETGRGNEKETKEIKRN